MLWLTIQSIGQRTPGAAIAPGAGGRLADGPETCRVGGVWRAGPRLRVDQRAHKTS